MHAIGIRTNPTGSSFITGNSGGNIQGGTLGLNLPPNNIGRRISWIERR
jgi:hypothetical protein